MPSKKISIQKDLRRSATLIPSGDGTDKSFSMSISSDTPYLRYDWYNDEDYYEVLDHGPGGMDDTRLKAGLPILFNHDRDQHIGRATSFTNDGQKCTVSGINFSSSDFAQGKKDDMMNGSLPDTSVGYQISDEGECIGAKDGIPIYKFKWSPYEASAVTVPADISVGAGRNRAKPSDEKLKEISVELKKDIDEQQKTVTPKTTQMAEATLEVIEPKIDPVKERADALKDYRERRGKINEWAKALKEKQPEWYAAVLPIAERHADGEADFSKFHEDALMAHPGAKRIDTPNQDSRLGLSKKERGAFSLRKAILESHSREGLTGLEKEICDATRTKLAGLGDSRSFGGVTIPDDMRDGNFAEDHDLNSEAIRALAVRVGQIGSAMNHRTLNTSVFSAGGALVGTDLLGGSMIDILRNAVLIGQGPLSVTELGGLVGNIAIPKQTGTATVFWAAEGATINESQQSFAQLLLTPHRMGAVTSYTKQLLAQASLSVEMFVRSDIALTMAVEEDRVTILGTGLNGEPLGIFNTTGTLANVTFGGVATWADIIALEFGLENANVRTGQMAILTSPLTKSYLKQTLIAANSTFPIFIWGKNEGFPNIAGVMPGVVNEYPGYATKNVTTNQVVQGVFNDLFKARWAAFDVVVDPYTQAASESIRVVTNQWLDIGLRYPQAFNVSTDAPTSPA